MYGIHVYICLLYYCTLLNAAQRCLQRCPGISDDPDNRTAQPQASINDGSASLIFILNLHHHLSRSLPRRPRAQKAFRKVSNLFYNRFPVVLTITPLIGTRWQSSSIRRAASTTPLHHRDVWGGFRLSRALTDDEHKPPPAACLFVGM